MHGLQKHTIGIQSNCIYSNLW